MPYSLNRVNLLTDNHVRAINDVLMRDQRVELIPTRDGVKIIHVKRNEVRIGVAAERR